MIGAVLWDSTIRQPPPAETRQWQRFRGWTIRILEQLEHSGGMSVLGLADRLFHRKADIGRYCRRLYKIGCIEPVEGWGWKITSTGIFLLSIYIKDTNRTTTGHKADTTRTLRQLTLAPFSDSQYSEPELAVTNLLLSHYNATGEKFIFIKDQLEICERLNFPPDILAAALRTLRQDGICYLWRDREYGAYQLRLKPAFLERLKDA